MKYLAKGLFCNVFALLSIILFLVAFYTVSIPIVAISLLLIGSIIFLCSHHIFFHKVLSEEMLDIIVTSKRIIYFDDYLFFCDNEHEIPLHRISGIEAKQEGLLRNILNYGTLWVDTGGGTRDLKRSIPNVPKPEELGALLTKLIE